MTDAAASGQVLGTDAGRVKFDGNQALRELLWAMTAQAQRTLDFSSMQLEPHLLDDAGFVESVRQLVLRSRRTQIRLLILEPVPLAARGHRLLDLAYQLPSYIALRVPGQGHKDYREATFIADNVGFIHRPLADRPKGLADFNAANQARYLTQRFEEIWAAARPSPHLRSLVL